MRKHRGGGDHNSWRNSHLAKTSSLSSLLVKLASSLLMDEFLASVWSLTESLLSLVS